VVNREGQVWISNSSVVFVVVDSDPELPLSIAKAGVQCHAVVTLDARGALWYRDGVTEFRVPEEWFVLRPERQVT
jgi:hypothetical protein